MNKVTLNNTNYAYRLAQQYKNNYKSLRWGQCIFNAYYEVFPEITNQIRGTDDDCYYNDALVPKFLSHFESGCSDRNK